MAAKRIGIVFNEGRQDSVSLAGELAEVLRLRGDRPLLIPWQVEDVPPLDLLVVLGGDGTFLRGANLVARHATPILGVNLGTLGFLAETAPEEAFEAVDAFFEGKLEIEDRVMLDVHLFRGGQVVAHQLALNDGVISKGASSRLVGYRVYVDAALVSAYSSDGMIVATPTGSTAYALSAGGPILAPDLPGFTVVPICPHSLTARPMVVGDKSSIKISLVTCYEGAALSVDGRKGIPLMTDDEVLLRRSQHATRLVKYRGGFYDKLRTKFHWSGTA